MKKWYLNDIANLPWNSPEYSDIWSKFRDINPDIIYDKLISKYKDNAGVKIYLKEWELLGCPEEPYNLEYWLPIEKKEENLSLITFSKANNSLIERLPDIIYLEGPIKEIPEIIYLGSGLELTETVKNSLITEKEVLINSVNNNNNKIPKVLRDLDYGAHYFEEKDINKFIKLQSKIVENLKNIKEILENINVKQGYISSTDIFDKQFYPLIADIAKNILKEDYKKEEISDLDVAKYYKWVSNILLFTYYTIANKCIKSINKNLKKSNNLTLTDFLAQFSILASWSERLLDPSIRQHLIRKRIKIIPETYAGYDTEYVPEDWGKNKLLSVQLSISGGIKVEVPLPRAYTIEGVNTLTAETYLKSEDSVPACLDKELLTKIIQNLINTNRLLLFSNNDENMIALCNYLINDKIELIDQYNRTEKGMIFQFKKLTVNNKFIKAKEGENLIISWKTLVKIINESAYKKLGSNIKEIFEEFKLKSGLAPDLLSNLESKETYSWSGKNIPEEETEEIILSNDNNSKESKSLKPYKLPTDKYLKLINSDSEIKMSISWRIYILSHYNAADLSLISDWDTIKKKNIDIIKGSFMSICKPIKTLGCNIYVRDTICLSSAAARTLEAIGAAHKIPKIEISQSYKENMANLLKDDPFLFKKYAMTDSIITLIHGLFINDFQFRLGNLALPPTLGSISSTFVKKQWKADNYRGYQIHPDYPLGNIQKSINPVGLHALGSTGNFLPLFIGNTMALDSYRGGRNEAYMYGIDKKKKRKLKDWDFKACYSTVMSMCGHPDYDRAFYLTNPLNISKFRKSFLIESYTAVDVSFKFPSTIQYPPLPVSVGKNLTIYPLEGRTIVTGLEYSTALKILNSELNKIEDSLERNKYFIKINNGVCIPFKKAEDGSLYYPPFKSVIKKLQANRALHPKKSAMERIWKDLGNMLYGKVVCGISNKRNYDARIEAMKTMTGSDLTNPIIGSWITAFVRSLMVEILNEVYYLGGIVPSATTDGFVCDIPDLENKLIDISLKTEKEISLKELTLARIELEGTLNKGEIIYSKISDLIKKLKMGWLKPDKTGKIISESIPKYIKRLGFKDNIIIGLDVITDPLNYIKGDIGKWESEIPYLCGPDKLKEKYKEFIKEYKEMPEILKLLSIIFTNEFNGIIKPNEEGPKEYIEGPNTYHLYENGKYKYPHKEKVARIIAYILDGKNMYSSGLSAADLLNFEMLKDSFVFLPEMSTEEKYQKYGWYVNSTKKYYNYFLKTLNNRGLQVQRFFRLIKCFIKYERILFGIINHLLSLFSYYKVKQLKGEISALKTKTLPLFNMYRNIRQELCGNPESLEVKTTVHGIIQWATRGQVSIENYELSGPDGDNSFIILTEAIAALTGFQKREIQNHNDLVSIIEDSMNNGNKIKYLQKRLTNALDNYKYNKHVSMTCSLANFRTSFDCKREVVISENNTGILYTKPFQNKNKCILHRSLMNNFKSAIYNALMDNKIIKTSSNILQESMKYLVRSFVNNYNYSTPLSEKIKLISIMKGYMKSYMKRKFKNLDSKFLQYIADVEMNKGMPVNKLLKYSKNKEFFDYLKHQFVGSPYYERFLVDFSNFL